MTVLSEMKQMTEAEAETVLEQLRLERSNKPKNLINSRAYIEAAKISKTHLVGNYTTKGGHKVVVIISSTNPSATIEAGSPPTQAEKEAADQVAEEVEMIRMTDPNKSEDDPSAELPEEI